MRYKVPQNIDMQDRILGPLTMVQFIYAVVGGGVCYAIYMAVPGPFSYFLIVPIAFFVAAMVFLKINERPFLNFLVSVLEFSSVPKQRLWHHGNLPDLRVEIYEIKKQTGPVIKSKNISRKDMQELAKRLDNPMDNK